MAFLARPQRALPLTLGLTAALALMPAPWLGWVAIPAEILSVPLQPMSDAAMRLGRLVRSPAGTAGESQLLRRRTEELEATRALLHAARLENEALVEEIEALQEARRLRPGLEMTPVYARVTGRAPDRAQGPVHLNAGTRHGVRPGSIAVYRGGYLVGRAADVSRLDSRLVPLTDRSTGLVEAVIYPAADPTAPLAGLPAVQLSPDGLGGLVGEIDRQIRVEQGDVVRLADPAWPDAAQGLVIGTVTSVGPRDLEPLLNSVVVRPRYEAQRVATVTLLVERGVDLAQGDAATGTGGGP